MITKISIAILVLFSCGTLYMLDYYIRQDQQENTSQMHNFFQQKREEAAARADAKMRFELQLHSELSNCLSQAVKTNSDYVSLIQKAVPSKRGQPAVPKNVLDEAALLLENANAECKKAYEKKLLEG